jgi:hypothetical protein
MTAEQIKAAVQRSLLLAPKKADRAFEAAQRPRQQGP